MCVFTSFESGILLNEMEDDLLCIEFDYMKVDFIGYILFLNDLIWAIFYILVFYFWSHDKFV
jgi:hypothetical protein